MKQIKLVFWPTTKVIVVEKKLKPQVVKVNKGDFDWAALPQYTLEFKTDLKIAS